MFLSEDGGISFNTSSVDNPVLVFLEAILKTLLLECGFSKVNFYNWKNTEHSNFDDHSQAYIPHMDKENGTLISLNVEATK